MTAARRRSYGRKGDPRRNLSLNLQSLKARAADPRYRPGVIALALLALAACIGIAFGLEAMFEVVFRAL